MADAIAFAAGPVEVGSRAAKWLGSGLAPAQGKDWEPAVVGWLVTTVTTVLQVAGCHFAPHRNTSQPLWVARNHNDEHRIT